MGATGTTRRVVTPYVLTSEHVECVPLYAVTDPETDTVQFLGTGTLIDVQGYDLLVTAAHVIENGGKFVLMIGGPEKPLLLSRPAWVTPIQPDFTRQTDPMDFGAIPLSMDEAARLRTKCRFVDWDREALTDVAPIESPHKIMGYPDTQNAPNTESGTLPANCLRIDVMEDRSVIQHAPSEGVKAHPTWYLRLRYDPRLLEKQPTRPKVDSLRGCSGGAIWRTDGARTLGFAGIVVECHSPEPRRTGERIVYGFRANAMDDLLTLWIRQGYLTPTT